jgi:Leucine-rich repeat (LRR) protein
MSFNKISEINENSFDNLVSLVNFNLRDNQLISLPSTIKNLQLLERLDVSNNNLSSLPCELAMIESLKQVLLVGNPLRTIRKDIISVSVFISSCQF